MKKNFWVIFLVGACFALSSYGKVFYHELLEFISPVEWTYQTTPTTPSAGKVSFYPKNDNKFYILDSTGAETAVGTGEGAGVFNYIVPNGDAEQEDISGWSCTGNLSMTAASSTPLFNDWSFIVTAAVNSADDYCEYDFDLMLGDNAQMLSALIESIKARTGYDTGDASLRLYDSDAPGYINNDSIIYASTLGMSHAAGFQTHPTNSNYKLRFVSNVNTVWEFKADNIKLERDSAQKGVPYVYMGALTTIGSWTTNTTYSGKYWRNGDKLIAKVGIYLTGAPSAANLYINLPSGLSIDTTKLLSTHVNQDFGDCASRDLSGLDYNGNVTWNSTTQVRPTFVRNNDGALRGTYIYPITNAVPFTFANGDYIEFEYEVPIAGWQAEANMSSTTLNRDIAIDYEGTATQTVTAGNTSIEFVTKKKDTCGCWTNDKHFTVPEDGRYNIKGSVRANAASTYFIQAYSSNTLLRYISGGDNHNVRSFGGSVYLMKGEILNFRVSSNIAIAAGYTTSHWISISKDNTGTEKLYKDAKVYVYAHTSVQTINHNTSTTFIPTIEVKDSHDRFVAGFFTAPRDDEYTVCHNNRLSALTGWGGGEWMMASAHVSSGSVYMTYSRQVITNDSVASSVYMTAGGCATVKLSEGQTVDVRLFQDSGVNTTLRVGQTYNWITIESE